MKKMLLTCVMLLAVGAVAWGATLTVMWDANTETDLAGYRLYQSDTAGQYTFGAEHAIATVPAGTETATVADVADGTWFWVLTAHDTSGNESEPSNEVTKTIDSTAPGAPRITITIER